MDPITLRLPEDLKEDLEQEAEESRFETRSQYIRWLLRNRGEYVEAGPNTSNSGPNTDRNRTEYADGRGARAKRTRSEYEQLQERVQDLEAVVGELIDVEDQRADKDVVDDDQDVGEELDEIIEEILSDWNPGRSPDERDERLESGKAVLRWLREQDDWVSAAQFRDALLPDFGVDGQGPDTWWRKTARPALQSALQYGVVEYRTGHHDYQWTG